MKQTSFFIMLFCVLQVLGWDSNVYAQDETKKTYVLPSNSQEKVRIAIPIYEGREKPFLSIDEYAGVNIDIKPNHESNEIVVYSDVLDPPEGTINIVTTADQYAKGLYIAFRRETASEELKPIETEVYQAPDSSRQGGTTITSGPVTATTYGEGSDIIITNEDVSYSFDAVDLSGNNSPKNIESIVIEIPEDALSWATLKLGEREITIFGLYTASE